jgi:4-hydroxymandelate oxidase
VTKARGAPIWFQLYATSTFNVARQLVAKAEHAGCPVVAITVDRVAGRNQEAFERLKRVDKRVCADCHKPGIAERAKKLPNYAGVDIAGLSNMLSSNLDWDTVKRLRDTTKMKIVLKGILTAEDAELAVKNGIDGVLVSNHGARSEDSGRATIDVLPEVVAAAKGRMTVIVDSGFRRGTDIAKAMAMGASAVGVGRPYLWGLGAFGEPGVAKVLEILRTEFRVAMGQSGVAKVKDFTPAHVGRV